MDPHQTDRSAAAAGPSEPGSLPSALAEWLEANLARWRARADLFALDLHRASASLVQVMTLVFLCAFLLWTVWFTTMAAIAWGVVELGGGVEWGLLLIMVINIALLSWAWRRAMHLLRYLTLPDVRAHFTGERHG